jgi:hypothetical protein
MSPPVLDGCCLINLLAVEGPLRELPPMGWRGMVPEVVRQETLFLRSYDSDGKPVREPIDLTPWLDAGHIEVVQPAGADELSAYVGFAAEVDDGEAMALAIARTRHWRLASDDRKALRIAAREGIGAVTTPELMQAWATAAAPGPGEVAAALRRIEQRARFLPPANHPLSAWWRAMARTHGGKGEGS